MELLGSLPAGVRTTLMLLYFTTTCLLACLTYTSARNFPGKYINVIINSDIDCNVTNSPYNAPSDGDNNATFAIQKALNNASCGKIIIPAPGTFLISALQITRSNMEFHIEKGATLLVSNDRKKWPGEKHIVAAKNVEHIVISGSGTINGQGLEWWQNRNDFRPHMVDFSSVKYAILSDTLFLNGPNHILELFCDYCELANVKVFAPPSTGECEKKNMCSHNTDAVDIHGSPFYIHDVNFTTGDDNVAAHANHTLVENSYFGTGHGASIGSLCNNWLTNITFRNITFHGTTTGARIKSHPKCTGKVWNITYENLTMINVDQAIELNQFYEGNGPSTYLFENIFYKNILVNNDETKGSDGSSSSSSMIDFNCDDHYDGKANCRVVLDNINFEGETDGKMTCKGTVGSSKQLKGINDCLKSSLL